MTIGSLRIAVIGGGIGGLTAALALRQAGFDVDVYEQAPELTEVGGGINMAPNATRILRQRGRPSPREKELRGFLASPPYRDGRSPEPFFGSLGHAQRVARRRDPHRKKFWLDRRR
jgi:flavin-dependent dehydrogenase